MIKIYAKNRGDDVDLRIKVVGNGVDIVHEAVGILTKLPEQLGAANPLLLKIVLDEVAKKLGEMSKQDEAEEVEDNAEPVEG